MGYNTNKKGYGMNNRISYLESNNGNSTCYLNLDLITPGVGVCTCEKKGPCRGTCRGMRR